LYSRPHPGERGVGAPHALRPQVARDARGSSSPFAATAAAADVIVALSVGGGGFVFAATTESTIIFVAFVFVAAAAGVAAAVVVVADARRGRGSVIHRAHHHQLTHVHFVDFLAVDAPREDGGGGASVAGAEDDVLDPGRQGRVRQREQSLRR
jgi:hypothetical protein